ncbi:MAG: hypothetical protein EOM69_09835 [Clostridia bacterium]|nr:hypothetical protein [Clostridia bacterium]
MRVLVAGRGHAGVRDCIEKMACETGAELCVTGDCELAVCLPLGVLPESTHAETILLCGDEQHARIPRGTVITYGVEPRNTLTVSSLGRGNCVIALQRGLRSLDGAMIEPCEKGCDMCGDIYETLVYEGAKLLLTNEEPQTK